MRKLSIACRELLPSWLFSADANESVQAMKPTILCCPGLLNLLERAGSSGLSAIVEKFKEEMMFGLQSRGISFDDSVLLKESGLDKANVTVNILQEAGFRYCPFCGTSTKEIAKRFPETLSDFEQKHRPFRIPLPVAK